MLDRTTFLKILGVCTGNFLFPGIDVNVECLSSNLRKTKIYDSYVREVHFRKKDFLALNLRRGDALKLLREADNKYDRFAIRVFKEDRFFSYSAAYKNIVLAMLVDEGAQLEASVVEVSDSIDEKNISKMSFPFRFSQSCLFFFLTGKHPVCEQNEQITWLISSEKAFKIMTI